MLSSIAFALAFLVAGFVFGRWSKRSMPGLKHFWIWIFWSVKVCAAFGLLGYYTYLHPLRETADVYKFFDDAQRLDDIRKFDIKSWLGLFVDRMPQSEQAIAVLSRTRNWAAHDAYWLEFSQSRETNWFHSHRFVTKIHMLLWPVSKGHISLHLLFFAAMAMCGSLLMLEVAAKSKPNLSVAEAGLIFFVPSVLFWCNGMLKDSVAVFALSGVFWAMYCQRGWKSRALLVTFCVLLLLCKYYLLAAALPAMVFFGLRQVCSTRFALKWFALAALICLVLSLILPAQYSPWELLAAKREEALKSAWLGKAQFYVFHNFQYPGIVEWILNLAKGLMDAVSQPWPGPWLSKPLILLFFIENLAIWVLICLCLWQLSKHGLRNLNKPIWQSMLVFAVCLLLIVGFTTPVLGNLLRYRAPALLFLLLPLVLSANIFNHHQTPNHAR